MQIDDFQQMGTKSQRKTRAGCLSPLSKHPIPEYLHRFFLPGTSQENKESEKGFPFFPNLRSQFAGFHLRFCALGPRSFSCQSDDQQLPRWSYAGIGSPGTKLGTVRDCVCDSTGHKTSTPPRPRATHPCHSPTRKLAKLQARTARQALPIGLWIRRSR